ncbi:MAG TPA: DNA ligase D [Thermoanaerobaculia bacterium]|jgi:bifunctional non-homologous end joining protein LigD|nr:DNA ligase D [Thermoanaerobaculia bacterium]
MALEEYRRKRDFKATPEPAGEAAPKKRKAKGKTKAQSFVIQKHAASRLHYDFRLEMEGVLRSWAVPKGPSLDPGEKRLAVHVEDHPLDYGGFEGIIPKGQYGGGTVLLWDRGTWSPEEEGDPVAAYRKGKLKFRLDGEKLHGGWTLVRMHGRQGGDNGENWLLIKENDDTARPGSGDAIVQERPESVESGQSLEEVAADPERVWQSNRAESADDGFKARIAAKATKAAKKVSGRGGSGRTGGGSTRPVEALDPSTLPGARKAKMPAVIEPELATLVDAVPQGEEWIHEIKYDGYRALCHLKDGEARLITRSGKDWTDHFAPVAREAATLPAREAVLDGEVVVLEADGTSSFQALQNALSENRGKDLVYFAFDLLHLDGYDLRPAPLAARKEALGALLSGRVGAVRFGDHILGGGEGFYRQACDFALEGIVCKRADLPYRAGRSKDWLKVKCLKRQEFVIVGFTDPEGSRVGLGALLLAVYEGRELVFAGKVGTGFTDRILLDLRRRLDKIVVDKPAFKNAPRGAEARRSHWVKPQLVGEVAFTEWTREGILRHPTFQGLREDKKPAEVVRERPQELPPAAAAQKSVKSPAARKKVSAVKAKKGPKPPVRPAPEEAEVPPQGRSRKKEVLIAGVRFSNPEKVLYPGQGVTKRDLAVYYSRIADWILPHVSNRPLTLVRCPEGQAKQCFYQKHVNEQFPESVYRVDVEESGKTQPYGAVDSLDGLLALVQMGVLELHVWGSHRDRIEQPDYVVFDFDPDEGLAWERVVEGAITVRDFLADLGLRTFLKTTGGKGLHVVLPLTRRAEWTWDEVKAFTKAVTETVVAAEPAKYTSKLPKVDRKGKVFIDYLRNGRGATSIAPFSTRARPGAPVSAPLFWEELESGVKANTWTVQNLPDRLAALPADPWEDFGKVRQSITAAMKKAVGMK